MEGRWNRAQGSTGVMFGILFGSGICGHQTNPPERMHQGVEDISERRPRYDLRMDVKNIKGRWATAKPVGTLPHQQHETLGTRSFSKSSGGLNNLDLSWFVLRP